MIRVHYSNRIEKLVDALASALPRLESIDAVFDGPWLIVPPGPLGLYLDLELARRRSISGNTESLTLHAAFVRLCARAAPDIVLVERGHVVAELLAALSDDSLKGDVAFAPLQAYLGAAGPRPDAVDRRRVDVARALGSLFAEWPMTRPELVSAWRAGSGAPGAQGDADGPLARAEQVLWAALFHPKGRFARRGATENRRYLTLDEVFAQELDAAWSPPADVHVFCPPRITRGLAVALSRLGRHTNLSLYVVNPCREFWEDLRTGRPAVVGAPHASRRRRSAEASSRQLTLAGLGQPAGPAGAPSDYAEPTTPDNPFLRAWGHAGRESTRLLNQLTDGDFDGAFVEPDTREGPGPEGRLLARLQRDILDRRPGDGRVGREPLDLDIDRSVQIWGAPNPRRELETIAAEIWALVGAPSTAGQDSPDDPPTAPRAPSDEAAAAAEFTRPLRFSDIAVVIAGGDEPYLSLARAVFREARDLPHAIVDQPITNTSHLIEAVLAVLALPLGSLSRREVLDVITHPNVLASVRARFPDADPRVWLTLCEALAIAQGADRAALSDTYIDGDLFNWDQGLRRLAIGLFASGPRSGVETPIVLPAPATRADAGLGPGEAYVPAEVPADLRADASALALLMRSLLADVRFARDARMTVPEWTRFVRALVAAYVQPLNGDDESARLRVFAALDELAAQAAPGIEVGLGTASELVRTALTGMRVTRGQVLGAGVSVGTLAALRSLPFRVIFVAGLGADRFPATDRLSPLDLEPDRQRAGDVTPRQHDRYLFLETLLAARDRLVLSYVDRDALAGEEREPSPVVLDLLAILRRDYRRDDADLSARRRAPLHRDEDPRLHFAFPAAAAESCAHRLGSDLQRVVPQVGGMRSSAIVRALSPEVNERLEPLLRAIPLSRVATPASGPSARGGRRVLRLSDLRRFLECPLQGSARVFMGLRDLPDDTEAREAGDEPLDVPRVLERGLLGDVLVGAWIDPTPPDARALAAGYDAAIARPRQGRDLPAGLFRANVRRRHLRVLELWVDSINAGNPAVRGPLRRVCFGRPEPFAPPAERRGPIAVTVELPGQGASIVEIHGITEAQATFGTVAGSLVLATTPGQDKDRNLKDALRAYLDHVALAASLPPGEEPAEFAAAVCRPWKDGPTPPPETRFFAPLDRQEARRILADLVGELLSGVHAYLFPCEAVFRSWDETRSLVARIDEVRMDHHYRSRSSSNWGPVPEPFDYPTPTPELAEQLAAARFGRLRTARTESPRARGKKGRP